MPEGVAGGSESIDIEDDGERAGVEEVGEVGDEGRESGDTASKGAGGGCRVVWVWI